jgi:hypothetical protein
MERVKGIEPSSQAWEAHVLPLNHTRFRDGLSSNRRTVGWQVQVPPGVFVSFRGWMIAPVDSCPGLEGGLWCGVH